MYCKVGFSQEMSMAVPLTLQKTRLILLSTSSATLRVLPSGLNDLRGAFRDTMGTKSVLSAQKVSAGLDPRKVGWASASPTKCWLAAGKALREAPHTLV